MSKKNKKLIKHNEINLLSMRCPKWFIVFATVIWSIIVLYNYNKSQHFFLLSPFTLPIWIENFDKMFRLVSYIPELLWLMVLVISAITLGGILMKIFGWQSDMNELEWLVFSSGLGFGVLSYIMLILGFLGLWNKYVVWLVLGISIFIGILYCKKDIYRRVKGSFSVLIKNKFSFFDKVLIFILLIIIMLAFIWSLTPEIFFDSLFYHLGVPNFYVQEGRIAAMNTNLSSSFTFLVQMLYGIALLLSNETLAKLIHFVLGLGVLFTLLAIGKRYASITVGLIAGVIFFSVPMIIMNWTVCGVEIGSAWYTLLAVYSFLLYLQQNIEQDIQHSTKKGLIMAAVFTGFACATKYPAFFTVVAGIGLIIYDAFIKRKQNKQIFVITLKQAIIFGVISGFVLSPWLLKNFTFFGNPIFPFLSKIFGGQQVDPVKWQIFLSDGLSRRLPEIFKNIASMKQFILHPWYLTMSGGSNADFVGPLFLILLPFFFYFRLQKVFFQYMLFFLTVMWFFWCTTTVMPRYFIPSLAIFSIVLAILINELKEFPVLKYFCYILIVVVSIYEVQWTSRIMVAQDGWQVVFGLQNKGSYLSDPHSTYPSPYYSAMEYINTNLPRDAKVLFVGETRSFYCKRRYIVTSVHDIHAIVKWARSSSNAEELQQKIISEGISHIFLNLAEAIRISSSYKLFQWDEKSIDVFNSWWRKYVQLIWKDINTEPQHYRLLFVYKVIPDTKSSVLPETHNYLNDLYLRDFKK